jgi:hypothetical protein
LLVRSWIEGLFLGDSTSGGGLKDKGKGRHEQWLHSNPDSKIGGGALNRLRYDHLPVYRSIGEMSVPTQRIVSPLGVADCDSLASMTFLCPGLPVKAIRTAATRYCGKTVTASSADGGAWAMTAPGAPCWSFCLSLRTRLPQSSIGGPRIRIERCAGRIVGCATAGDPLAFRP